MTQTDRIIEYIRQTRNLISCAMHTSSFVNSFMYVFASYDVTRDDFTRDAQHNLIWQSRCCQISAVTRINSACDDDIDVSLMSRDVWVSVSSFMASPRCQRAVTATSHDERSMEKNQLIDCWVPFETFMEKQRKWSLHLGIARADMGAVEIEWKVLHFKLIITGNGAIKLALLAHIYQTCSISSQLSGLFY